MSFILFLDKQASDYNLTGNNWSFIGFFNTKEKFDEK